MINNSLIENGKHEERPSFENCCSCVPVLEEEIKNIKNFMDFPGIEEKIKRNWDAVNDLSDKDISKKEKIDIIESEVIKQNEDISRLDKDLFHSKEKIDIR